jgi:hypothetical protein
MPNPDAAPHTVDPVRAHRGADGGDARHRNDHRRRTRRRHRHQRRLHPRRRRDGRHGHEADVHPRQPRPGRVGTTVIATFDGVTGANLVAGDDKAFTLSAAANLNVTAGDALALAEAVTSTGTANPGGELTVQIARR